MITLSDDQHNKLVEELDYIRDYCKGNISPPIDRYDLVVCIEHAMALVRAQDIIDGW